MNYRAILLGLLLVSTLAACQGRPVSERSAPSRMEPQTPLEAPAADPALEDQSPQSAPVPNADAANSTPPCLPEVVKPKTAVRRRPRPAPESGKPAAVETEPPRLGSVTPEVKVIESSVASILGKKIAGADGEDLGRVVDVQADSGGRVRLVIIEFGGFLGVGNRRAAVDWGLLRFHPDDPERPITLSVDSKLVQETPEYRQASHPRALMAPEVVMPSPKPAVAAPSPSAPQSNPTQLPTNLAPPQSK